MRDRDDRALTGDAVDGGLDLAFGLHVNGCGGLVEHDDRGVAQDGARDGDALLLAAGEAESALADLGLVAVGHMEDILVDVGRFGGLLNLLGGCVRAGIAYIFRDGTVEEERVLKYRGDVVTQARERHVADIVAVDEDAALYRVVEAGDQLCGGGLAHAGRSDECDHHTRLTLEGDILEDRDAVAVVEADVVERDSTLDFRERLRVGRILDLRRRVEDQRHTLGACQRLLQALKKICKARDRCVEEREIEHKRHDVSHGELAAVREVAAEEDDQHRSGGRQKLHAGVEQRAGAECAEHRGDLQETLGLYALSLVLLLTERLDLVEAGEAVLQLRVELAHRLLRSAEEGADHLGEDHAGDQDQRDRCAGDERQFPVDREEDDEHSDKCYQVGDDVGDHMRVQQFKIARVVDDAAHQVTGLLVVEEREVEALQLVVEAAAEVADEVPRGAVREIVAQEAEEHAQQIEAEQVEREAAYGRERIAVHALAHDTGHLGENLRRGEVNKREREGGAYGNHIQPLVACGFLREFPECPHSCDSFPRESSSSETMIFDRFLYLIAERFI